MQIKEQKQQQRQQQQSRLGLVDKIKKSLFKKIRVSNQGTESRSPVFHSAKVLFVLKRCSSLRRRRNLTSGERVSVSYYAGFMTDYTSISAYYSKPSNLSEFLP